ncbi:MAG: response regulator [Bdellovibrio sp.]|nr:MAG: response regulator [Bdellovibrio sp.]
MKVLIVDDEPLVRRSLKRILNKEGWLVEEAIDGLEGLQKWKSFQPDLVLLDVLMPGLSGPQVMENMKPETRGPSRVILMSAYTGDWNQDKTRELGADLFLAKPFENIFEVVNVIKKLVA